MAELPIGPRSAPPEAATAARGPLAFSPGERFLLDEASEPMLVGDPNGRFVYVNRSACELTGFTRDELLRMSVLDLISPESQQREPYPAPGIARPSSLVREREMVRRDGSRFVAEVSIRYLEDGGSLAIIRDMTRHRAIVDELRGALSLVQSTLESTTDGILVVNRERRFAGYNRKFAEIWGMPPGVLESGNDELALQHAVSQLADPETFLARVQELYEHPEESSNDEIQMKDGRVLERYSIPQRLGNAIVGRVWSFRDVSEARRQAQALRESEQRLLETQKLEAVGRLAGGVAHDFNNMLTAILGEADLLLLQPELDGATRTQIQNIRSAALRSARLTRQLLAFARRQLTQPRPLDLRELVVGLDPLVRRLAGRSTDVRFELPAAGEGPWVLIDPTQLEQAILNLVINAGDAMPVDGLLRVRLERAEVAPADAERRGAPRAGAHARLSVIDNGIGIPEAVKPNLFEPFFTTKPPGKGTGLGLASVLGIIQQAQGFIEVESDEGRGAAFHVMIPECEQPTTDPRAHAAGSHAAAAGATGARRVLVVDDEERVRRLVSAMLLHAGIETVIASGAEEAFALARLAERTFDLLLTDVRMPGADGPAVARALLAEGRVRRVMFMSGYAGDSLREELADLGKVAIVSKPFRADELVERVNAELAALD